jgi:diaminopimelate epimerase
MSKLRFQKWQGAGNDFIIVDNRDHRADSLDERTIEHLCDRHFGIGADGLMLVGRATGYDFEMVFFNNDGKPAEMCGNGGRCIAAMASESGLFTGRTTFLSTDGPHEAEIAGNDLIRLKMKDVNDIMTVNLETTGLNLVAEPVSLNTGVPHLVLFVEEIENLDVNDLGRKIRFLGQFAPAGTNVNFVRREGQTLFVRTYERGVETETLACGTGNVASALAAEWTWNAGYSEYECYAVGGTLKVSFKRDDQSLFEQVWLEGPAVKVFDGEIEWPGR